MLQSTPLSTLYSITCSICTAALEAERRRAEGAVRAALLSGVQVNMHNYEVLQKYLEVHCTALNTDSTLCIEVQYSVVCAFHFAVGERRCAPSHTQTIIRSLGGLSLDAKCTDKGPYTRCSLLCVTDWTLLYC